LRERAQKPPLRESTFLLVIVRCLINQTAFYLAKTADILGQEDDIAALTALRQAQALAAK
jgi:hypothetical protein